jgi:hypothetical protein
MTQEPYTKSEFIEAGCMQFENVLMGFALYTFTGGQICRECPKINNCSALRSIQAIHRNAGRTHPHYNGGETVREEAVRRGIGIKEVRRQRNAAR